MAILPFTADMKVLELGGGDMPIFHPNLDVRPLPGVDIVADLNRPLPVDSESYDGVFLRYLIEHISWRKVRDFVGELHRILRPGGVAFLITANLLEQAKVIVNTQIWDEQISCLIFGGQDYPENSHKSGFSPEFATRLFREVGFYEVKIIPIQTAVGPTDMGIEAKKSNAVIRRATTVEVSIGDNLMALLAPYFEVAKDNEVFIIAKYWAQKLGDRVLEVGPRDEPLMDALGALGYQVEGIDLRPFVHLEQLDWLGTPFLLKRRLPWCQGDFLTYNFPSQFDAIVSASTIEHIGLSTYGETQNSNGDILSMRKIYGLLKKGGRAYITVPYGGVFETFGQHWRRYDAKTLKDRIIGDFEVEVKTFVLGQGDFMSEITEEEALTHIAPGDVEAQVFLRLKKG